MTDVALSYTLISFLITGFGMASLYLMYKLENPIAGILSTVFFAINIAYSGQIPFATTEAGYLSVTPANYVLMGINFLFMTISLLLTIREGFFDALNFNSPKYKGL